MHTDKPFTGIPIAIVGGDEREQEIARLAAAAGAGVTAFGFPWPAGGIAGVKACSSAGEALAGARYALFPIPGMTPDGGLFATTPIIPDAQMLAAMAPGAHIILGRALDSLRGAAAANGITLHEYEHDQELMLLRAPAITEGLLRVLIENTVITIHDARICVIGFGNMGSVMARTLVGLGARVTVAARNRVQRASAYTLGAQTLDLDAFREAAAGFDIIISTVPARILDAALIDTLAGHCVLVDVAAPPGSIDLDYANESARKGIWARALGRRAPVTVGASQWSGIRRIIEATLANGATGTRGETP